MLLKTFKKLAPGLVIAFSLTSFNAVADDAKHAQAVENITEKLSSFVQGAQKIKIAASPVDGLYQVTVGPNVVYMTADASFLFNGNLMNLNTRQNLTEDAKAVARKEAVAELDVASMIEFPASGEQKHVITVFTDIDCPYCKKFHQEVPELNKNGVTVRYMAYPRSGPETPSYFKMVSIWCADDKKQAMDAIKNGESLEKKTCENPVLQHMNEAQNFGVNGTPTLIFDNGEIVPGYAPAKELLKNLN